MTKTRDRFAWLFWADINVDVSAIHGLITVTHNRYF